MTGDGAGECLPTENRCLSWVKLLIPKKASMATTAAEAVMILNHGGSLDSPSAESEAFCSSSMSPSGSARPILALCILSLRNIRRNPKCPRAPELGPRQSTRNRLSERAWRGSPPGQDFFQLGGLRLGELALRSACPLQARASCPPPAPDLSTGALGSAGRQRPGGGSRGALRTPAAGATMPGWFAITARPGWSWSWFFWPWTGSGPPGPSNGCPLPPRW